MRSAILTKWGNSQGLRIPKEICDELGVDVGAQASMDVDALAGTLVVRFSQPQRKYRRTKKVTMEDLLAEWSGGKVGEEWGGPDVGAEVVE